MTTNELRLNWYVDQWDCINVVGRECRIWIDRRPSYCDRGNFLAHIEPHGRFALELDEADGWPRYYFDLVRAKLEIEAWLFKRNQNPQE